MYYTQRFDVQHYIQGMKINIHTTPKRMFAAISYTAFSMGGTYSLKQKKNYSISESQMLNFFYSGITGLICKCQGIKE